VVARAWVREWVGRRTTLTTNPTSPDLLFCADWRLPLWIKQPVCGGDSKSEGQVGFNLRLGTGSENVRIVKGKRRRECHERKRIQLLLTKVNPAEVSSPPSDGNGWRRAGVVAELGLLGHGWRGLSSGGSGDGGESQGANSEAEPLRGNAKDSSQSLWAARRWWGP